MFFLRGPKRGGATQIDQLVNFKKGLKSAFFEPFATVFYVDAINGSDTFDGRSPDDAKATIQAAVTAASPGDIIYVNPQVYVIGTGHARYDENVVVPLATSDLSIIGTGYSRDNEFGVRLKSSTSGYCLDFYAPSGHVENIGLFVSGGTGPFIFRNNGGTNTQRGSDGFTMFNCHSKGGEALVQGGQAGRIINGIFHLATGTLTIAIPAVSGYNQQIKGCHFLDNNGAQTTKAYITGTGAHTYSLLIKNCDFERIPAAGKFVTLGGTLNTGLMTKCWFNSDNVHLTNDLTMGGTNMRVIGCFDKTGNAITAA